MGAAALLASFATATEPVDLDGILAVLDIPLKGLGRELNLAPKSVREWRQGRGPGPDVTSRLSALLQARGVDPVPLLGARGRALPGGPLADRSHLRLVTKDETPLPPPPSPPPVEDPPMAIRPRRYLDPETLRRFSLSLDPFDDPEDPSAIWLSPELRAIERQMMAAINRHHMVVLTAEPGAGKTTLLRRLQALLDSDPGTKLLRPASLDRSKLTSAALAAAIVRDLSGKKTGAWGQEDRSELLRAELEAAHVEGVNPVLLLDEAHRLPASAILAIKQVWDGNLLKHRLGVILVGQTWLDDELRRNLSLREFTERAMLLRLPALDPARIADYLRWRWKQVGASSDATFDPGVYAPLAAKAKGPLALGNLVVDAMEFTASQGDTVVTADHVGQV